MNRLLIFLAFVLSALASPPQQMLLAVTPAAGPTDTQAFVSASAYTPRQGYTGDVGWGGTVGTVHVRTALSRYCLTGNIETHTLTLYDKTAEATIATVSVTMLGKTPGTMVSSSVATSGTLPYTEITGHVYTVTSSEIDGAGHDTFCDVSAITTTGVLSSVGSTVGVTGGVPSANGQGYGFTGYLYH